jgi:hypothetical protein
MTARQLKAMRRCSLAIDRLIRGENPAQARKWAFAWARAARIRP